MSSSYPEAVREGAAAAARLHKRLETKERNAGANGSVDVHSIALDLGVSLLFRPLKGLLGAFLPFPAPGILVTTERPLRIQRFTTAHEVGHYIMKHAPSLDDEGILRRGMLGLDAGGGDFQEIEANAFAASFLMPTWLIAKHCQRHNWTGTHLRDASTVYQLALRLGTSFEATCWTLSRNKFLSLDEARAISSVPPRSIKAELLGDLRPESFHGDVWLLTDQDEGTVISGSPNDHFVVRLKEHSGGGYLWDFAELERSGFLILRNAHVPDDNFTIGANGLRQIVTKNTDAFVNPVRIFERRPWNPQPPLNTIHINFDLSGPEQQGFCREEKRRLLEAA